MDNSLRAGSFVFGGLFLGVWLYLLLFGLPPQADADLNLAQWSLWGLAGVVIAGGLFAGRLVAPHVRLAMWIATGIAIGLLATAIILQQQNEAVAAILTFLGGALIGSAVPLQNDQAGEEVQA